MMTHITFFLPSCGALHNPCDTPGLSLLPAQKKYNTHPPLSVIHSSCKQKEKAE
jgi:hypothetical protein